MHRTFALPLVAMTLATALAQVPPEFDAASLKINRINRWPVHHQAL